MSNVLVTGGSGYVGSVLVRALLRRGHKVRVLDAGYFGHDALREVKNQIELVEDDIRTCSADVLKKISHVVHLAGFSNDPTAEYRPKENFTVNVDGTRHIAELAKKVGVEKFVFGSSCSVYYTTNPDDQERTEEDFIAPAAPYSLSKHLAEDIVLGAGAFTPVVFRKGTVYGLSPRMRYDLVVNTMLKDAFTKGIILLHQGGRMRRPLVSIENAVHGYVYAVEHQDIEGIFNLIDMNILVRDLAVNIQEILKRRFDVDIRIESLESGVARSYQVSGAKLTSHGFAPPYAFEDSVVDMWNDLKSRGDLEDERYYNIRMFERLFNSHGTQHGNNI